MLENKNIDRVIVGLVLVAMIFTGVFIFAPDLLGVQAASKNPEYLAKLFDKEQVVSISIEADEEDWQDMLDNATAEEYIACDLTINGETYKQVGIRPKGNSTLSMVASSDSDRYSFKIKMDEYVSGQSYYGLTKFVINNMLGDNTYMKEYLAYDLNEFMGVDTPAYAYANIEINGEEWGLYLAVEAVEEEFAARTYGADYGQLYKPESMAAGGGGGDKGERPDMPDNVSGRAIGGMPDFAGGVGTSGEAIKGDFGGQMTQGGFDGQPGEMPDNAGGNTNTSEGAIGGGMPQGGFNGEMPQRPDNAGEQTTSEGAVGGGRGGGFGGMGAGSDVTLVYTDDEIDSYSSIFDNAVFGDVTDGEKKKVIEAIKVLNTSTDTEEIEKYIDVEQVLKYFAVNTVLVNTDSYVGSFGHNYYLYEEDGQLSVVPWDLNLAFAGFATGSSDDAVNFPIDTPYTQGIDADGRPLIGKLLEIDSYKEMYHEYLQQIVDEYFESGLFESKVNSLSELISPYVEKDATAFCTYEEYQKAVEVLKEYGELRAESIEGQILGTIPSTWEGQEADSSALIDASAIKISDMGSQMGGMGGDFERGNAPRGSEAGLQINEKSP